MFSFGKKEPKLTPKEQTRKWQKELRSEMRVLDRQIRNIERQEAKAKLEIKKAAKRGDTATLKLLAKEVVQARKARDRIHTSKAQMNSVSMKMQENLAMIKVTNCFEKSTDMMRSMSKLLNVPEISATMRAMAMEMEKAGVIEEMMEDATDVLDGDLDDEVDEEVDALLYEVTAGQFGTLAAPSHGVAAPAAAVAAPAPATAAPARVAVPAGGDDSGLSDLEARLRSL